MVAEVPPVPAPQTTQDGAGCGSCASCPRIDSAMLLLPRQSVARSASPNWSRKQAPSAAISRARCCGQVPGSVNSQRPPSARTASILGGAVHAGITATKGSPSRRANHASEIAVLPEEASTTVCPARRRPLHNAYRNSERASRCLRLPLGCAASSLK